MTSQSAPDYRAGCRYAHQVQSRHGIGTLDDRMLILVEAAGALRPRCMTRQKIVTSGEKLCPCAFALATSGAVSPQ